MKRLLHILSLGVLIAAGQVYADENTMGWQKFKVSDAQKDRPVSGLIWYPAENDARVKRIQSNGVWVGVDAAKKATPKTGWHKHLCPKAMSLPRSVIPARLRGCVTQRMRANCGNVRATCHG